MNRKHLPMLSALVVLMAVGPAWAADGKFDLGLRTNVVAASGKPTNDIIGYGLFGHYRIRDGWSVGFAVDHSPEFDFERTPALLGLETPSVVDAVGTSTTFSGWIERTHPRPQGKWELFWTAGFGINSVDVDRLTGTLVDGGTYDINTDAGTEFLALVSGGARRWFGESWGLEVALRVDQHFADWTVTDRVSGASAQIGDYTATGVHFGFLKRF